MYELDDQITHLSRERDNSVKCVEKLRDFLENKSGYKNIRSDLFQDERIANLLHETKLTEEDKL